jgi:hypothetical protein
MLTRIDALIAHLDDEDEDLVSNLVDRLSFGVPPDSRAKVADALVVRFERGKLFAVARTVLEVLGEWGGKRELDRLEAMLDSEIVPDAGRAPLERTIEAIRKRLDL